MVTDVDRSSLAFVTAEMERRFELSRTRSGDITSYNNASRDGHLALVVVIDELAELMAWHRASRKTLFVLPTARATGIHLIVAHQRPSVT